MSSRALACASSVRTTFSRIAYSSIALTLRVGPVSPADTRRTRDRAPECPAPASVGVAAVAGFGDRFVTIMGSLSNRNVDGDYRLGKSQTGSLQRSRHRHHRHDHGARAQGAARRRHPRALSPASRVRQSVAIRRFIALPFVPAPETRAKTRGDVARVRRRFRRLLMPINGSPCFGVYQRIVGQGAKRAPGRQCPSLAHCSRQAGQLTGAGTSSGAGEGARRQ